ncbi:Tat proofreading chaperone DmsD, partial [Adlercreutzia rubneri]|nr:Tat proofreading chaperone DmsD [Adlercreutzia rubneri]
MSEQADQMVAVAFAGASLAPFFLNDPRTGDAADAFAAMAEVDVAAAAAEWPFVYEATAADALALMREGLA